MTNDRDSRWYMKLMAPPTEGKDYGWIDPATMYSHAQAFNALLDDLTEPFSPDEIDVVTGTEPFGFVLGAAIAARLGKGILTIQLTTPVATPADAVDFPYSKTGNPRQLEIRKPAFAPGTRVLVVDNWVETGGAMRGALELIERQGGTVAGIATNCIEESPLNNELRKKYKCSTAVLPGTDLQRQCNKHWLDSFDEFTWELVLPERMTVGQSAERQQNA